MAAAGTITVVLLAILVAMVTSYMIPYEIGDADPRHDQCAFLHGAESRSCPANIYENNKRGDEFGNCRHWSRAYVCDEPNVMCGTLHCTLPGVVTVQDQHFKDIDAKYGANYSFIRGGNSDIYQGCFVTSFKVGQLLEPSTPGEVMNGTICGSSHRCSRLACVYDPTVTTTTTPTPTTPTTVTSTKSTPKTVISTKATSKTVTPTSKPTPSAVKTTSTTKATPTDPTATPSAVVGTTITPGNGTEKGAGTKVEKTKKSQFKNPFFLSLLSIVIILVLLVVASAIYLIYLSRQEPEIITKRRKSLSIHSSNSRIH